MDRSLYPRVSLTVRIRKKTISAQWRIEGEEYSLHLVLLYENHSNTPVFL